MFYVRQLAENARLILKTRTALVALSAAVGATVGSLVAYRVALTRVEAAYAELLAKEVADAKKFYRQLNKREEYASPGEAVEELMTVDAANALRAYAMPSDDDMEGVESALVGSTRGTGAQVKYDKIKVLKSETEIEVFDVDAPDDGEPQEAPVPEVIRPRDAKLVFEKVDNFPPAKKNRTVGTEVNVFHSSTRTAVELDLDVEQARRDEDPEGPYVISLLEFLENEEENIQGKLTWYDGDMTLIDDRDVPIDDVEELVGDCLTRFGQGSSDPNLVYVRNPKMNLDFEIAWSDGEYTKEVLGNVIRHSSERRPTSRRFRIGDDE